MNAPYVPIMGANKRDYARVTYNSVSNFISLSPFHERRENG